MYEAHFGLNEKPFSLAPDPDFLYLGKNHSRAWALIDYSLNSAAGLTVITGEVGAGKTTLIHRLLNDLNEDITVGLISNAHSAFGELLQWVLMAFGLDCSGRQKVELYQRFSDFLIDQYANNKHIVLIIDEAQNLDLETLEELRMLTNINSGKDMVLQLILVGQPELLETMRRPELRQLAQRVSVNYHLDRLQLDETIAYIRHRIKHAGGDPKIFNSRACAVVYYHSQGTPRLINILCDYALVYAFAEGKRQINAQLMLEVIKDKLQGSIFPMRGEEDEEAQQIRRYLKEKHGLDIAVQPMEKEPPSQQLDIRLLENG